MDISRREFMKKLVALGFSAATAGAIFSLLACQEKETPAPTAKPQPSAPPTPALTPGPQPSPPPSVKPPHPPSPEPGRPYLAVSRGKSPTAMVQSAIKALGGIERFVKPGNDVIVKPNICVAYRSPEYAATTNPEVVGALVALCVGAGAKRVRVMDNPFGGEPKQAYIRSGIDETVRAAGGEMEVMSPIKYKEAGIPQGLDITSWPVYSDVLNADVLINVPIAKHHSIARLTLGMKNLLGVILEPNQLHTNLGQPPT